jgi:hypothetical protein
VNPVKCGAVLVAKNTVLVCAAKEDKEMKTDTEILALAETLTHTPELVEMWSKELIAFARAIAKEENEACAQVCEKGCIGLAANRDTEIWMFTKQDLANEIRARQGEGK